MKYLGCAYYPEYWGVEHVQVDAPLMQAAGINLVRIGEFAWSRMEPSEGQFSLDWLHQTIQILGQHGINVILCTPTATPPAWLTFAYPETLLMQSHGQPVEHGSRRHYCYTSDSYWRHTLRIVEKLSSEFAGYANVIAWQIDNEPDFGEKGICYCENCQAGFQTWLQQKYGSLAELNQKWGTGFWSMDYSDWRQVRLGTKGHSSSRQLDTRRFASQALSEFVLMQAEIIKKNYPQALVSTNLNGDLFTALDYNHIFSHLDVAYKDLYFDICTMDVNALIMDQFRSFIPGQKYWVTETGAGMCGVGRPAHSGQFKAWMWSSFADGADAHVVFRWRTCLSGQEQELEGMLEHSGHPGHRYRAVQDAFLEMRRITSELGDLPLPKAEIAMVHDYEVMWAYQSAEIGREMDYGQNFTRLHQPLYRRSLLVDVISPHSDLQGYKLILLPSLMIIQADFAERLKEYVRSGGVILAQGQIGMRDANDNYLSKPGPEYLQDLLGVSIHCGMYLHSCVDPEESWQHRNDFSIGIHGQLDGTTVYGSVSTWLADLENRDSRVLFQVSEDTYAGQPVIVEKRTGSGLAIYAAAANVDDVLLDTLIRYAITKAEIACREDLPRHTEVIRRGPVTFVINHSNQKVRVPLDLKAKVARGCYEDGVAVLEPYEVVILTA